MQFISVLYYTALYCAVLYLLSLFVAGCEVVSVQGLGQWLDAHPGLPKNILVLRLGRRREGRRKGWRGSGRCEEWRRKGGE